MLLQVDCQPSYF